ncbi:MAG: T9SS type A sorting domain-containing protein [Bacteroidales bacterium]|nr:T9SS type A sorting domain-containing protein [Bacteroidales bacterium]
MRNKLLYLVLFSMFLFGGNEMLNGQKLLTNKKEKSINIQWIEMGPCNYGGRTRALLVDKNNPNLLFAGGIAGGLWKSTTGGTSWMKVANSDMFENIAISCIYQATNGDIYFGTGEYFGFDGGLGIKGNGIWKSTDGGNTWTQLQSTNTDDFAYVTRISGANNKIYAATIKGIRISTDGGQTWTNPIPSSDANFESPATDIEVSSDGSLIVASLNNKAYICNTGNDNFIQATDIPSDVIRLEFAIAPTNVNHVYCFAVAQDGKLKNIYESKNKGNSWTPIVSNVTSQFQPFGNAKNKQGRYHCSISVDPTNEDKIYLGGVDLYAYTPSTSFVQLSMSSGIPTFSSFYVHENIHNIVFSPNFSSSKTIYVATDGGVFKSTNSGYNWAWIVKNYNTMDFLNVAIADNNEVVGGTVHNGILHNNLMGNTDKHFFKYLSGTIGSVQRLTINPDFMIVTRTYGSLIRTYQGGNGFSTLAVADSIPTGTNGHSLGTSKEPFLAPIRVHEKYYDPNSIFKISYIAKRNLRLGDTIFVTNSYGKNIYHIINSTDLAGDTVINKDDTLYVQDHYQVLTALGLTNRVWISWNALDPARTPSWYPVANHSSIKKVNVLEFTADGDIIYFAGYDSTTNTSTVFRLKNIQAARTKALATAGTSTCVVSFQKLGTFQGKVQSLGIDPQNNENLVVTIGDHTTGSHVYYSTNAASTTNDTMQVNFVSKQGNLPNMPVYASIVIWNNSQQVMLGTDKGIWFTEDITATNPVWIQQIDGMANVPVSDLRQQILPNGWIPNNQVVFGGIPTTISNHGVIFASTRGRGIFRCENFRGPVYAPTTDLTNLSNILIYPNPVQSTFNIDFNLSVNSNADIKIMNLNGQVLLQKSYTNLQQGKQTLTISASGIPAGIYIISVESKDGLYLNKLIKQ